MTLTNEDLKAISQLLDIKLDERLKPMNDYFESIDTRLDAMDQRFDAMDARLDAMDARLDAMDQRFDAMDARLDAMDQRFDVIEFKLDHTSKKLNDLQLNVKVFERDIRKDIRALKDDTETLTEILKINELIPQ